MHDPAPPPDDRPADPAANAGADPTPAADATPPLAPARARRLRRRLLARVADADDTHRTVAAGPEGWQPFLDGVTLKVLRERDGVLSYLLRLAPGAVLPPHRHRLDEECVVLSGQVRVGTGAEIGPGGYHLAHAGSLHAALTTVHGATIFLRGAVPEADDLLT